MGAGERADAVDRSKVSNQRQPYAEIRVVQREIVQLQKGFQEVRNTCDDDGPRVFCPVLLSASRGPNRFHGQKIGPSGDFG